MSSSSTISALLTLLLLPFLPSIHASGIPVVVSPNLNVSTNPNVTAHLPSCTNLTAAANPAPNPYCYTKLQETAYLTNWNLTSPEICAPQELWSTCFLRSIYRKPGPNCTSLSDEGCEQYNCTTLSLSTALCPRPVVTNGTTNVTTVGSGNSTVPNITTSTGTERPLQNQTTAQYAQEFYGAFSLYALQNHISTWSTALSAPSSRSAILAAVNPRIPNTPSSLLQTLISAYGLNTSVNADAALIELLGYPGVRPVPAYGNARIRGEGNTMTGQQWQGAMRLQLGYVLDLVMGRFDLFLGAVEGGAYSAGGLASVGNLTRNLGGG